MLVANPADWLVGGAGQGAFLPGRTTGFLSQLYQGQAKIQILEFLVL